MKTETQHPGRPLTGRTVFAVTALAFGVIIGVNVLMAYKAVSTFPGLEVANSYVASQTFDADRKAQEALGWSFAHDYADGRLALTFRDAEGRAAELAGLTALVGRTTEAADDVLPDLRLTGGTWQAPLALAPGRWMVRVDAVAADGTKFHKRFDIVVRR